MTAPNLPPSSYTQPNAQGFAVIGAICKWCLEFTRNVLVVGGFFYLADRSESVLLKSFAWITVGALFIYLYVSADRWVFQLRALTVSWPLPELLIRLIWVVITFVAIFIPIVALYEVIEELRVLYPR